MKKYFLVSALLVISFFCYAQSVSINNDGASPDATAILDVQSSAKGVLFPRMIQAERLAIISPAKGLLVYQTDGTEGYYYNSGTPGTPAWVRIMQEKNTVAFSATSSVAQGWAGTAYVKVIFPTEEYDESANFVEGATSEFTAPMAGIYHFDASVAFQGPNNNSRFDIAFFVNGVQKKNILGWNNYPYFNLQLSADLKLAANDKVDLRLTSFTGGGNTLGSSPQWIWFNGHKVN